MSTQTSSGHDRPFKLAAKFAQEQLHSTCNERDMHGNAATSGIDAPHLRAAYPSLTYRNAPNGRAEQSRNWI